MPNMDSYLLMDLADFRTVCTGLMMLLAVSCVASFPTAHPSSTENSTPVECKDACEYDDWFDRVRCHERNLWYVPASTGCGNATVLEIQQNNIETIHTDTLRGYPKVNMLDLSKNQISLLETGALRQMPLLRNLLMSHNRLETLTNATFTGPDQHLKRIHLDNNLLIEIEKAVFTGLQNLEYLNLGFNRLRSVNGEQFHGMLKLEQLIIGNNELCAIESYMLHGLIRLESIALDNNNIKSVPFGLFDGLTSLRDVDLSGNSLVTVPPPTDLGLLVNIRYLYLEDNSINQSASLLPYFEKSHYFFIGGNPFVCDCDFQDVQLYYVNKSEDHNQPYLYSSSLGCFFNGSFIDVNNDLPAIVCPANLNEVITTTDSPDSIHSTKVTDDDIKEARTPSAPTPDSMTVTDLRPSDQFTVFSNAMKQIWAMSVANTSLLCLLIAVQLALCVCSVMRNKQ